MPQITFKNDVTPIDLPIPTRLRSKIDGKLTHARGVAVIEMTDGGKRTAVNSFRLTEQAGTDRPVETVDAIALAIVQIMQHHSAKRAAKDADVSIAEGILYRIEILKWKDAPGPARPSFSWRWKLLEEPEAEDDDAPIVIEDGSHEYLHGVIRMLSDQVERQASQMHAATARVISMAERMAAPLETVQQQLQFSSGVLHQGMAAMVSALQTTYSFEHAKEIESAKTARMEKILERLGPAASIATGQIMKHFKIGDDEEPQPDKVEPVKPPKPSQPQTSDPEPTPQPEPVMGAHELCASFRSKLTAKDRALIEKTFSTAAVAAFDAMTTAKTEAAALAAYPKLKAALPSAGALLVFRGQLDPDAGALVLDLLAHLEHRTAAD